MEVTLSADALPSRLEIQSHRGPYRVTFRESAFEGLGAESVRSTQCYIVDERLVSLYPEQLDPIVRSGRSLLIAATEQSKSLDRFPEYVVQLLAMGFRRDQRLVAVGGGVIQDIACFLASTVMRGVEWEFFPTTLLAQADSCIGSKSSINVGQVKNILGTFWPPAQIAITTGVLATLSDDDIRSGIGEMLKVHIIDGPQSFDRIARDLDQLRADATLMRRYLLASLQIKQRFIEADEFDKGVRNVMNYGHSFGHAIESATEFGVPHGVAVTLGMDLANHVAVRLGRMDSAHMERMRPALRKNAGRFLSWSVPVQAFFSALGKDKKNVADRLALILPDKSGRVEKTLVRFDDAFRGICADYFADLFRTCSDEP
jgi:3-dehydroquinate synthase